MKLSKSSKEKKRIKFRFFFINLLIKHTCTPHETQIQDLTAHLDANFLKDSSSYILSYFYKFELAESKT